LFGHLGKYTLHFAWLELVLYEIFEELWYQRSFFQDLKMKLFFFSTPWAKSYQNLKLPRLKGSLFRSAVGRDFDIFGGLLCSLEAATAVSSRSSFIGIHKKP